jgi:16S rRNA (adenine1518-N6/adenine1519-N6)-dimethyltransferase
MADMSEELFDVVDEHDRVVGQAPRSRVHAERWLHRAVHIFVFNSRGELLVHKRSATKDECPLLHTSSASGHLQAGEDYLPAAVRELAEELELHAPLEYLHKFPGGPETSYEHSVLFRTVTDAAPVFDPEEIESGAFLPLDRIAEWVQALPDEFTPCFRTLFRWYWASSAGGDVSSVPDAWK